MMNDVVVPVTFMSGTGGNFVSSLITAAKKSDKNGLLFTRHGNAHNAYQDLFMPGGMDIPYLYQIKRVLEHAQHVRDEQLYVPLHIAEIDEVMQIFQKSIRITYQSKDIEEISKIWIIKWGVDAQTCSYNQLKEHYKFSRIRLERNLENFQPRHDFDDRVLNLNWQEIYNDQPNILAYKLSQFTGYDVNNFYLNSIKEWRSKTATCIDVANRLLK